MSDSGESSAEIQDELLAEVKEELERRGTTVLQAKPEPEKNAMASMAVTAILTCLALLAGSGIAMSVVYVPTIEDANASTAYFEAGALGSIIRAIHFHASNLLVVLCGAYLGYLAWKGLFRRPGQWRWWRAAALIGLVVAFSLSGQTLPADQLALHGTSIRLSYLAEMPVLGETLRTHVLGGDTIGSTTLSRFFTLHVLVLPALTLILLRWLWKDGETEGSMTPHFGMAGAVAVLVIVVSVLIAAPLGLQGNLGEPYPEARPEWFALPLYAMLKILPPGVLHLLVLFVPPVIGGLSVVALPYIERAADQPARQGKQIKLGLIASGVGFLVFGAIPIIQDMSNDQGWFTQHSQEEIMTAMGKRNAVLSNSADPLPADAHNAARDMELLYEQLIGNYPEKIDDAGKTKWDELSNKGIEVSQKLLMAPDAAAQIKARAELREICEDCHKDHDKEDVRIDPPSLFGTPAKTTKDPDPEVEKGPFFDPEKMAGLTPTELKKKLSTSKLMDQMKYRMKDILIETGALTDNRDPEKPKRTREQALVDLIDQAKLVGKYYEKNEGAYWEETKWDEWVEALQKAADKLVNAKDAAEVAKLSAEVGKSCESCHDGADDPDEPIEWTFQSLLAGED